MHAEFCYLNFDSNGDPVKRLLNDCTNSDGGYFMMVTSTQRPKGKTTQVIPWLHKYTSWINDDEYE